MDGQGGAGRATKQKQKLHLTGSAVTLCSGFVLAQTPAYLQMNKLPNLSKSEM